MRTASRCSGRSVRSPDFRKTLAEDHVGLVRRIYLSLVESGRLPPDWVGRSIERLAPTEGDIDTLTARISHVRTWTYVSHRSDWVDDAHGWQERTRSVEDALSDALHAQLTQLFVNRRARMARISRARGRGALRARRRGRGGDGGRRASRRLRRLPLSSGHGGRAQPRDSRGRQPRGRARSGATGRGRGSG